MSGTPVINFLPMSVTPLMNYTEILYPVAHTGYKFMTDVDNIGDRFMTSVADDRFLNDDGVYSLRVSKGSNNCTRASS